MINLKENIKLQEGKYQILKLLGDGGFGITYLAEQTALGRKVAIKEFFMRDYCIRDGSTSHVEIPTERSKQLVDNYKQKFIKEAQMIASLNNSHIVRIYDIFEENGTAYYVMEYIEKGSLLNIVNTSGPLNEDAAVLYIKQVADALNYLHKRSILHLDVKPSNILIDDGGNVVLIDFGISKHYDPEGGQTSATPVGISKGYAPMEQYQQGSVNRFSPATDIYSLGATLYFLLTGKTPPEATEIYEDGLPEIAESINKSLAYAIRHSMEPKRKDRPQSVDEFIALLSNEECDQEQTLVANNIVNNKGQKNSQMSSDESTTIKDSCPNSNSNLGKSNKLLSPQENDSNKKTIRELIPIIVFVLMVLFALIYSLNSTIFNKDSFTNYGTEEIHASSISMQNEGYLDGYEGEQFHLDYTVEPGEAINYPVIWSSSNPKVAVVSSDGTITIKTSGRTLISASVDSVSAECNIEVHIKRKSTSSNSNNSSLTDNYHSSSFSNNSSSNTTEPSGSNSEEMSISSTYITMEVGYYGVIDAYNYGPSLHWRSDDPSIATVDSDGIIAAISPGQTYIWAEGKDNIKCLIVVTPRNSYRIAHPGNVYLHPGDHLQLESYVGNITKWESENENVATISSSGVLTGKYVGETNVWGYVNGHPHRFYIHVIL